MTNQTKIVEEVEDVVVEAKNVAVTFVETAADVAHKAFLASLGVVSYVQEEVTSVSKAVATDVEERFTKLRGESDSFTDELIARGTSLQTDTRNRIQEAVDARRTNVESVTTTATKRVDSAFDTVLSNFNLPSQSSIEELNKKVGSLGRKIDKLRKAQEEASAA